MKAVERILIKIIIIQLGALLFSQWFFHHLNAFPKLTQTAKYEGVNKNSLTEMMETFSKK
ncbi:YpfB family protein [Bacillota bacterium Lsc_1132]